jgi:hypothetical protein
MHQIVKLLPLFPALLCADAALAASHKATHVNGISVDQYAWTDSAGRTRTVSLKREGDGNSGHGGYAIQMTYYTPAGQLVTANSDDSEGFGYFVSHERYRDFDDGDNNTIAGKIFHTDDSPLGRGFPVVGRQLKTGTPGLLAHRFTMTYPRYGTVDPIEKDADGNDVAPTPTDPNKLALYHLPITIMWTFQDGTDYPRIMTTVSFGDVPGPDRVNFDIRGPYGVMVFDNNVDRVVSTVMWGDRFHFKTLGKPATRGSSWIWQRHNTGARYHALIAGSFEMGLFEPTPFKTSALRDGYADERHSRSSVYRNGQGCDGEDQLIPCDWEWPYQSLQYSLPENRNEPANYKKIAWGSSAYYGSGPSLPLVYDTANTAERFKGFPNNRKIVYSICVVLGLTVKGGLTQQAAAGPDYNCAAAKP